MDKIGNKMGSLKQETMMKRIENKLSQKILLDEKVKENLLQKEIEKLKKHKKIQLQLEKINQQNLIWIKKIQQFNQLIQNKKTSTSISQSFKEEKTLLQNYHKLQLQLQKIKAVKKQIRTLQGVDLHQISIKNSQITHVIKKNLQHVKNQSQSVPKIQTVEQKSGQPSIKKKSIKSERKTKSIEELKQLGRKYLQFAKNAEKSKSEKRMLNLQNKNIDYGSEMKELIKLKVEDLSKLPEIEKQESFSNRKKRTFKQTFTSVSTLTQRTQETQGKNRSKSNFDSFQEKKNRFSLKNIS